MAVSPSFAIGDDSAARTAQKYHAQNDRIPIFVGPNVRDGFVDVDQGVLDSIKDIQDEHAWMKVGSGDLKASTVTFYQHISMRTSCRPSATVRSRCSCARSGADFVRASYSACGGRTSTSLEAS
jgi:hypothetical protein